MRQPVDTNVLADLEEIEVEFWMYKYKRYDTPLLHNNLCRQIQSGVVQAWHLMAVNNDITLDD